LEVIGEGAAKVSLEFRDAHPEIAWRDMIGMRNRLIHNYSNVSLEITWDVSRRVACVDNRPSPAGSI
jgi:uncharacterized protein with HEPN domain